MQDKLLNRMAEFIQLERDLRAAPSEKALGFVLTNYLRKLLAYDVALLVSGAAVSASDSKLFSKGGIARVVTVSGVSEFDEDAPIVDFAQQVVNQRDLPLQDTQVHTAGTLPTSVRSAFSEIEFSQFATMSMSSSGSALVLFRDTDWQLSELQLLQQVSDVASHALHALQRNNKKKFRSRFRSSVNSVFKPQWALVTCGLLALTFLPVRQSVIASGEIAAVSPTVIAAGIDAVVKEVQVLPNQYVEKDQVLINFESSSFKHQRTSVYSELELAREKLRKARQQSLNTTTDGHVFSELETQIKLKQLELDYIDEQMSRLQIRAERDGIVLFSRKKDWEGRAVMTGEKIMEIAGTDDSHFEIWLSANDAIGLDTGAPVKFFPDADPLQTITGNVKQVGYFAASSASSHEHVYRVVASRNHTGSETSEKNDGSDLRLGMKGTFRLYGEQVSLGYHLFRKPISVVRRTLGV